MSSEFKNIVKVACLYVTTVIGAGFASGQEIIQFFSVYYSGGFWGILLAGALFSVIGCIVLDRVYSQRIRSYDEFIFPTLGWIGGWVVQIAVTIFMLCLFSVMIAGSANIFFEKLGLPFDYSALAVGLLCMVFILSSVRGIVMLGTVVTPVLIAGMLLIGFYVIVYRDSSVFSSIDLFHGITHNWFFSSLLYISYNSLMSVLIMCNLLPYLKTQRTGRIGGILGGSVLCFVALVLNTVIFMYYPGPAESELPILGILGKYGSLAGDLYAVVLWLAMFTSAVTSGYCFVDRVGSKVSIDKRILTVVLCAAAVPLSTLGFSRLIAAIYPFFGYLGLFLVLVIILQGFGLMPLKSETKVRK